MHTPTQTNMVTHTVRACEKQKHRCNTIDVHSMHGHERLMAFVDLATVENTATVVTPTNTKQEQQ